MRRAGNFPQVWEQDHTANTTWKYLIFFKKRGVLFVCGRRSTDSVCPAATMCARFPAFHAWRRSFLQVWEEDHTANTWWTSHDVHTCGARLSVQRRRSVCNNRTHALAKNASRRIQFVQARLTLESIPDWNAAGFRRPNLFPVPIPPRPQVNPCGIQHTEGNQDASEPDVSKVRLARLSNGFPRLRSAQMIAEIEFDEFVQSGSSKGRSGSSRKERPNTHSGGGILAGKSF